MLQKMIWNIDKQQQQTACEIPNIENLEVLHILQYSKGRKSSNDCSISLLVTHR